MERVRGIINGTTAIDEKIAAEPDAEAREQGEQGAIKRFTHGDAVLLSK